jgi:hypothetical protein
LIQIDGSDHRWFEDRGDRCTLLVFIDDATSKLMQLRFVPSESTDSYFEAFWRNLYRKDQSPLFDVFRMSVRAFRITPACELLLDSPEHPEESWFAI